LASRKVENPKSHKVWNRLGGSSISSKIKEPGGKQMANGSDDRNVLVSVLAGIGMGVLVGAAVGLLLAPKSGEETRDDLSRAVKDLNDKITDLGRTLSQKVAAASDKLRTQMAQKIDEGVKEEEEAAG
jgi:gas vesicle protein